MAKSKLRESLELIVAILALAVSIFTFTFEKVSAAHERRIKENRILLTANRLGQNLASIYVVYTEVTAGDDAQIKKAQDEVLYQLTVAQAAANQFELTVDLKGLLLNADKQNLFPGGFYQSVSDRIEERYGSKAVDAYFAGVRAFTIYFNARVWAGGAKEKDVIELYPQIAENLNSNLEALGISDRMPPALKDLHKMVEAVSIIKKDFETKWPTKD